MKKKKKTLIKADWYTDLPLYSGSYYLNIAVWVITLFKFSQWFKNVKPLDLL